MPFKMKMITRWIPQVLALLLAFSKAGEARLKSVSQGCRLRMRLRLDVRLVGQTGREGLHDVRNLHSSQAELGES